MEKSVKISLPDGREAREIRLKESFGGEIINIRYPVIPFFPSVGDICREAARLVSENAKKKLESAVIKYRFYFSGEDLFVELSDFFGKKADCKMKKIALLKFRDGEFVSARRPRRVAIDKKRSV